MSALVAKEIRLLLPAYVAALLLAVVPVWLMPNDPVNTPAFASIFPFGLGIMLLALSSFGREFWLKTFALTLVQPLERNRIWWTKVAMLAATMASVFLLWCLSCAACVEIRLGLTVWKETLTIGGMATILAFVGGLWTTLLLRQVAAAFWFTILVPGLFAMPVAFGGGSDTMMFCVLGLYAAGGFWLAHWLFFRAQEVGWTGGTVVLPWRTSAVSSRPAIRSRRPLAALFWKELQLQQIALAGMGGLFLLHLGDVVLRKAKHASLPNTTLAVLQLFGWLWLAVPFLIGAASVAEERKLGTMESHLTLPVSRRLQFAVKLIVVLAVGGLLSAVLLWTAESFATAVGAHSGDSEFMVAFGFLGLAEVSLMMTVIALLSFFASTLTRNLLQALAAAVVTVIAFVILLNVAHNPNPRVIFGDTLWQGYLLHYLLWPILTLTVVWLAWRNFKSYSETWRLCRRNILAFVCALLFVTVSTAAIYHRVWELATPLEPAHGPVRLAGTQPVILKNSGFINLLTVVLPDGRVWNDFPFREPGHLLLSFGTESEGWSETGNHTGFRIGAGWHSWGPRQFLPGSNWVDMVRTYFEAVGIRSDGTLWVSESPHAPQRVVKNNRLDNFHWEMPDMVRFGDATNWQRVFDLNNTVYDPGHCVLLLRNDGTLWYWGTNAWGTNIFNNKTPWPGLRNYQPRPLVDGSNWTNVLTLDTLLYGIKKDGTAWVLLGTNQDSTPPARPYQYPREWKIEPGWRAERAPQFDHMKSLVMFQNQDVGLRDDGTLWVRKTSRFSGTDRFTAGPMLQIGNDSDWTAVSANYGLVMAALKADGSLWMWHQDPQGSLDERPLRLGNYNDWRAVIAYGRTIVSLAADGSLWDWSTFSFQPMLAPSRRPTKIENIFDN